METSFDFSDLTPLSCTVTIGHDRYLLREATEDQAVKYKNMGAKAAKFKDSELSGIEGAANTEPFLLSMTLVRLDQDNKEIKVTEQEVRMFPSRIVQPLFEWVKEASGLGAKETLETLNKKIAELTKKKEALLGGQADDPKEQPNSTSSTSS